MDVRKRRIEIFKQVQDGRLTLEEASRLLAVIDRGQGADAEDALMPGLAPAGAAEGVPPMPAAFSGEDPADSVDPPAGRQESDQEQPKQTATGVASVPPVVPAEVITDGHRSPVWQGWWLLVFVPGLLLIVAAANWMYEAFLAARLGWGFWLSFIPFTLGIVLVWLGWEIHLARWLYVHIRQRPGAYPREMTFQIPLPAGWMSWLFRQAARFSPHFRESETAKIMEDIDQAITADGSLQISIDDPRGDQIEIWMEGPK